MSAPVMETAHYSSHVRKGRRINDAQYQRRTLCGAKVTAIDLDAPLSATEHAANRTWFERQPERVLCPYCQMHAERRTGKAEGAA